MDRLDFLKTLAEACQKTGWWVHAYCLMPNHYHLVLETPEPNLVAGMAWLQSTYTIRLNHRHRLFGHVFGGRYKAQLVEGSGNGYLRTACDYVHLNPVRARMLPVGERLLSYPWSSFGAYLAAPKHRPGWMRVDRLLGEHGIQEDTASGRQRFEQWMEKRRAEEGDPEALKALRRGWCLGGEGFRRETTLSVKDIAARVQLGSSKGANANLHAYLRSHPLPNAGAAQRGEAGRESKRKLNQSMG